MNKVEQDILYLASCALHQVKPDVEGMDFEKITKVSMGHTISSMVDMALESADIQIQVLMDQKNKAIRKIMLLDAQRKLIYAKMDEAGIWHMSLKGILLKDLYPVFGMRQMADNDILFDKAYRKEVRDFFVSLGYEIESYGTYNHDVYQKEPIYNYEMHVSLFHETLPTFYEYYVQLEKKYKTKDGYEKCMDVNDAYVYFVAHAYKHFTGSGTGIRTLIDLYVYNKSCKDCLDYAYIEEQCRILGIYEFEQKAREMAYKLFDTPTRDFSFLNQDEQDYVQYYFSSGTYGTMGQRIENEVNKLKLEGETNAKRKYLLKRLYPGKEHFQSKYKILKACPFLLPVAAILRLIIKFFTRWSKWRYELKKWKSL